MFARVLSGFSSRVLNHLGRFNRTLSIFSTLGARVTMSCPKYLIALHVVTAGLQDEDLGSDEEEIVQMSWTTIDTTTSKVGTDWCFVCTRQPSVQCRSHLSQCLLSMSTCYELCPSVSQQHQLVTLASTPITLIII